MRVIIACILCFDLMLRKFQRFNLGMVPFIFPMFFSERWLTRCSFRSREEACGTSGNKACREKMRRDRLNDRSVNWQGLCMCACFYYACRMWLVMVVYECDCMRYKILSEASIVFSWAFQVLGIECGIRTRQAAEDRQSYYFEWCCSYLDPASDRGARAPRVQRPASRCNQGFEGRGTYKMSWLSFLLEIVDDTV
jgi:hypothetical protein